MKEIHIAIGSTTSLPGELVRNLGQIGDFANRAAEVGADFLLTPELSASGYGSYPEVLATAETAGAGPIHSFLADCAGRTGVVLCAGFVELSDSKHYLSSYVVYPDGSFVVQRKNRITPAEHAFDSPATDPWGDSVPKWKFFEIKKVRCALAICADIGLPNVYDTFEAHNISLVFAPAGAGGSRNDRVKTADLRSEEGRLIYLGALEAGFFPREWILRCIEKRMALAAVNLCGHDGRIHYHAGHGLIVNPMGEILAMFHGLPNLDRQRPMFCHGVVDLGARIF